MKFSNTLNVMVFPLLNIAKILEKQKQDYYKSTLRHSERWEKKQGNTANVFLMWRKCPSLLLRLHCTSEGKVILKLTTVFGRVFPLPKVCLCNNWTYLWPVTHDSKLSPDCTFNMLSLKKATHISVEPFLSFLNNILAFWLYSWTRV